MSVKLYIPHTSGSAFAGEQMVVGQKNIKEFISKGARGLRVPLRLTGHKDHILEVLQQNADLHVSITHAGTSLNAFCVAAVKPAKKKLRIGRASTPGVSAMMFILKWGERAALGAYMSLHVTDEATAARDWGAERHVTYERSVTFKDLETVVRAY